MTVRGTTLRVASSSERRQRRSSRSDARRAPAKASMGDIWETIETGAKKLTSTADDVNAKIDQVKLLLMISTGASAISALIAFLRRR